MGLVGWTLQTLAALAAFSGSLLVQQDFALSGSGSCLNPASKEVGTAPLVYIPTVKDFHLSHVKESFVNAGYDIIKTPKSDDWDVMWTYHSPFSLREGQPDITTPLMRLKPKQRVNQIPGASWFSSKKELSKSTDQLTFIPKTFQLPKEFDQFKKHTASNPDSKWLYKSEKHRGVKRVDPATITNETSIEPVLLQEAVGKPFLIDGKLFDAGFYIAITSVDPLRVYIADDVLIRAAPKPYEDGVDADPDTYVVGDDYTPPWALPSMRRYYTWGMTTLNVMRAYLSSIGRDPQPLLDNVAQVVAETMLHFQPKLIEAAKKYPNGSKNFFSLYRMDIILDENLKPHVIEINQSCNLSSAHFKDLATMFRKISTAFIRLAGLHRGGLFHPDTPDDLEELMLHHGFVDIGYDICGNCTDTCEGKCVVCRRCRIPAQSQMLKETLQEHANQEGFLRVYPATQRFPKIRDAVRAPLTTNDKLLRLWIDLKCRDDPTWC